MNSNFRKAHSCLNVIGPLTIPTPRELYSMFFIDITVDE